MNQSIRIKTKVEPNKNSYLKIKLEQGFDFLDILSLKISQDNIYRKFCSDYGVVIGRVTANNGFGLPNMKVSIFIPIDDVDKENPLISGLYPYEFISDKNIDDKRYNLLTSHQQSGCHIPVGSFPDKREFLDNDSLLEIYEKYYKFTTTTNQSGDFMIFGIPTGSHKLHIDGDLSDIGDISLSPYDLTRDGSNSGQFDSPTQFKQSDNLNTLTQIVSTDASVEVKPFWGEADNCDIGINRVDYNIPHRIEPSAIFIGSTLTDTEKHGINRRCRARRKAGLFEETESGGGRIEMIRKRIDGSIERKDIDGGELIDDDGVWAYQIPMNLEPMVTNEAGELIPSEDPQKGLFTSADVRFRVSMHSGSEGNKRKKAKYLIPHNPATENDVDYAFDSTTKDSSFFNMRWYKVYTSRNYIPRMQANLIPGFEADSRSFIGLKDVDRAKDKVNFPYSRMDTNFNPIFSVVMALLGTIVVIITLLNSILFPIINLIIYVVNWIINLINTIIEGLCSILSWLLHPTIDIDLGGLGSFSVELWDLSHWTPDFCTDNQPTFPLITYLSCITLGCDSQTTYGVTCDGTSDGELKYAPGCCNDVCGDIDCGVTGSLGVNFSDENIVLNGNTHPCAQTEGAIDPDGQSYLTCQGGALASYFEMYTFDFYNDWVNGSLYFYLFKASDGSFWNGNRDFCDIEYTTDDSIIPMVNHVMDTSVKKNDLTINFLGWSFDVSSSEKTFEPYDMFSTGVIKQHQVDNETFHYYYAPVTTNGIKLFATDITSLGSIKDCDIDGLPKFINHIPSTTYTLGPLLDTIELRCINGVDVQIHTESGIIGDVDTPGLFMNVNMSGLYVNYCQSRNFRLQSELGRTFDVEHVLDGETITINKNIGTLDNLYVDTPYTTPCGQTDGLVSQPGYSYDFSVKNLTEPNGALTQDIEDEYARFCLRGANTPYAIANSTFDDSVEDMYTNPTNFDAHNEFRGFNGGNSGAGDGEFRRQNASSIHKGYPHHNSYYFYFGVNKGATAIDKLNRKYLAPCEYVEPTDITIQGESTDVTVLNGTDGTLDVDIIGGVAPYDYEVVYPDGSVDTVNGFNGQNFLLNNIPAGDYVITVVDSENNSARGTFSVLGPAAIAGGVQTSNVTVFNGNDGEIMIVSVNGGSGTYTYEISGQSSVPTTPLNPSSLPIIIGGLSAGSYTVTITDANNPSDYIELAAPISSPPEFEAAVYLDTISCHDANNGSISMFVVNGGNAPFMYEIDGNSTSSLGNLTPGVHTFDINDNTGVSPAVLTLYTNGDSGVTYIPPNIPNNITLTNPTEVLILLNTLVGNGKTNGVAYTPFVSSPVDDSVTYFLNGNSDTLSVVVSKTGNANDWSLSTPSPNSTNATSATFNDLTASSLIVNVKNTVTTCSDGSIINIKRPNQLTLGNPIPTSPNCGDGNPTGLLNNGLIKVSFGGGVRATALFNGSATVTPNVDWLSSSHPYNLSLFKKTGVSTYTQIGSTHAVTSAEATNGHYTFNTGDGYNITHGEYKVVIEDLKNGVSFVPTISKEITGIIVTEPITVTTQTSNITSTSVTVFGQGGTLNYEFRIKEASGGTWTNWTTNSTFGGLTPGTLHIYECRDIPNGCTYNNTVTTNP